MDICHHYWRAYPPRFPLLAPLSSKIAGEAIQACAAHVGPRLEHQLLAEVRVASLCSGLPVYVLKQLAICRCGVRLSCASSHSWATV